MDVIFLYFQLKKYLSLSSITFKIKQKMKKVLFAAIAVLGFMGTQAQEVKFGAKAGLNIATLTGDLEDASSKVGFHVGGFAEIMFSDKFAFQPELLFSTQGAKAEYNYSGDGYSEKEETTFKLNYLNIPLMAKYFATEKLFIEAGPQIGFAMGEKYDSDYTVTYAGETYSESEDGDLEDISSIDFGLNFGLGYEFTENIFAGARYNLGLSNVYDGEGDGELKNSVFQISVGYKF